MTPLIPRPTLVVTVDPSPKAIPSGVIAYSRLMPELLGRGLTPDQAVGSLVARLSHALEMPDEFHRSIVQDVLDEVRGHISAGDDRL